MPRDTIQHYRYDKRWIELSFFSALPEEPQTERHSLRDSNVMLCYLYQVERAPRSWDRIAYYPFRQGTLVDAFRVGDVAHFYVKLGNYFEYEKDKYDNGEASDIYPPVASQKVFNAVDNLYATHTVPTGVLQAAEKDDTEAFQKAVRALHPDHLRSGQYIGDPVKYNVAFAQVTGVFELRVLSKWRMLAWLPNIRASRQRLTRLKPAFDRVFDETRYELHELRRYAIGVSTYHGDDEILKLGPKFVVSLDNKVFNDLPDEELDIASRYDFHLFPIVARAATEQLATAIKISTKADDESDSSFVGLDEVLSISVFPRKARRLILLVELAGDVGLALVPIGLALFREQDYRSMGFVLFIVGLLLVMGKFVAKWYKGG